MPPRQLNNRNIHHLFKGFLKSSARAVELQRKNIIQDQPGEHLSDGRVPLLFHLFQAPDSQRVILGYETSHRPSLTLPTIPICHYLHLAHVVFQDA